MCTGFSQVKLRLTLRRGLVAVAKLLAFPAGFAEMDVQSLVTLTLKLAILVDYLLSSSHSTSFIWFSYYFLEDKYV